MAYKLGKRSKKRLKGLHPDMVKVVELAITYTEVDFTVLETVRTLKRQKQLVKSGASTTMNSRHLVGPNGYAMAVDLGAYVGGKVRWDWPLYYKIEKAMKKAAKKLGVQITWGGDWKSFKDGPHYQLSWKHYPK